MRRILRNCAHAARPNGEVLVAEDSEQPESASTEMGLLMLAYFLGGERSLDKLTDLAHEAGLAIGTVTPARSVPSSSSCRNQTRRKPVDDPWPGTEAPAKGVSSNSAGSPRGCRDYAGPGTSRVTFLRLAHGMRVRMATGRGDGEP